jgi:pyruvate dehydrogenase E2 component (dihydrolipoamide acetyltransferase)
MSARAESGTVALETTGAGAPIVLIHGVGTNRSIWSRAVPALAAERSVTMLDLPGFGRSPPPERWQLEPVAASVAAALEQEVGEPFDLVGSSLGGAVALTLAAARPDLIRRLLLAAPAGVRPAPGPLPMIAGRIAGPYLFARRTAGLRFADSAQARRLFLAGTVADGSSLDVEAATLIWRASEQAVSLRVAMTAAAAADLRRLTRELELPFGLIWGSLDRIVPAHTAERILEIAPDAPLELIAGAGHIPHLERPREFVQALERVIEQLP